MYMHHKFYIIYYYRMEKTITNIIDECVVLKTSCKAQIVQASHSPNPKETMRSLRSCYETSETCDLLMLMIANRSPCVRSCITFSKNVFKRCDKECSALKHNNYCKKTATYCTNQCKKVNDLLTKFKDNLH